MEDEIKILEDFINNEFQKDKLEINEKGGFKIGTIYKVAELSPAIENLIKGYRDSEEKLKKAYREANNILYFDDSSDYCCALWEILRIINPDLEDYPNLEYIELEDE